MSYTIKLDTTQSRGGPFSVVFEKDGDRTKVTLTEGKVKLAEASLGAGSITRMRARLRQNVELVGVEGEGVDRFKIFLGIFRLEITSTDTGFDYVLTEGPAILAKKTVSNDDDTKMRKEIGADDPKVIEPASVKRRREPASEDNIAAAMAVADRR